MTWSWLVISLIGFILIKHAMDNRARQERDRLRILEEALRQGNLDDKSREELMRALTGRTPQSPPRPMHVQAPVQVGGFLKFLAFVGWVSLCVGLAFVILVTQLHLRAFEIPAVVVPCAGFALVTFPFVIRELQASPKSGRAAREQRA